ncbi:MAG: hypothetical protein AAB902_02580 [Patescibacteria group bacterium]
MKPEENPLLRFGQLVKEGKEAVNEAFMELVDKQEILLENPNGTVKTVTVLREVEVGYHCNDESSFWSFITRGKQIFLRKDDPRIRSVHRMGLK